MADDDLNDDNQRITVFLATFVGGPAAGTDVPLPLFHGNPPPETICSDGELTTQHWHYLHVGDGRFEFAGPCTEDNGPHSWHEHPEPRIRVHRIQIAHGSVPVTWWQKVLFYLSRIGAGIVLALIVVKAPTPIGVGLVVGLFIFLGVFAYRATRFTNSLKNQQCLFCGRGQRDGTGVIPVPALGESAKVERLRWYQVLPPPALKVVWVCEDDLETYLAARRANPAPDQSV